jgi:hypothetical protein
MTQFTCKGVKQINNRISLKYDIHLYHSYLSAFFVSAGVPNGEFPEILIAKCRSRFYCTWFFSRWKIWKVDGGDPQNWEITWMLADLKIIWQFNVHPVHQKTYLLTLPICAGVSRMDWVSWTISPNKKFISQFWGSPPSTFKIFHREKNQVQ